jgi:putative RNA 2'-phosphotransferase
MTPQQLVRTSKFLSLHLRHRPDQLGLQLQPGGWVDIEELLAAVALHGESITRAELDEVVASSDKQRFSVDTTGTRIRANQGHSVAVDLQLEAVEPPPVLYHGTHERAAASIAKAGLRKMRRQHVHLSPDPETACRVGARRGRPVIFEVDAAGMHADGHTFFRSENGVWLVDAVPARFLHLRQGS